MKSILIAVLLGFVAALNGAAATPAETRSFTEALNFFNDGHFELAEKNFQQFLETYPASERLAEAVLLQARARLELSKLDAAIAQLKSGITNAGRFADQYIYSLGAAHYAKGQYAEAAKYFQSVSQTNPPSTIQVSALLEEARSYAQLGEWQKVVFTLTSTNTGFLSQPTTNASATIFESWLLLGEAYLKLNEFPKAESTLQPLVDVPAAPGLKWRLYYLLAQAQLAVGKAGQALSISSNLTAIAMPAAQRSLQGRAVILQAQILQKLGRPAEAVAAYEKNLADGIPEPMKRDALENIIQFMGTNRPVELAARLQRFIEQNPNDANLDLARTRLAELQIRFFASTNQAGFTNVLNRTNFLQLAQTNLSIVLQRFTNSPLAGEAWLHSGWAAWWLEDYPRAETNFQRAAELLQASNLRAIAQFKLGDALFKQKKVQQARDTYNQLIESYNAQPQVREALYDLAYYQLLQASLTLGDVDNASKAARRLVESFPSSIYAPRSLLLAGQALLETNSPAAARELFQQFGQKFPDSDLLPEVQLAMAKMYELEGAWRDALSLYDHWLTQHTNHASVPHAEFSRAIIMAKAGESTNALAGVSNVIDRFPTHAIAPLALNWLADYYFNLENFPRAERYYQRVFQNTNATPELALQAMMMAGRAAFAQQDFKGAREHFSVVINRTESTNTPQIVTAQAYHALGDTIFAQYFANTNRPLDLFRESITAYARVTKQFPSNSISARAWGRIGDAYLQQALLTTNNAAFVEAMNAYSNVITSPVVTMSVKNEAQFNLGYLLEKKGNLDEALENYLKLLYSADNEAVEPRWAREAGLAAGRLAEGQGNTSLALNIYQRLMRLIPAMRPALESKILSARQDAER